MRIAIGSDHAATSLKQEIGQELTALGHEVTDFGVQAQERADYPDVALPLARAVAAKQYDRGVLLCGTGIGMSIVANKVRGVRAALCTDPYMARMAREHNNAQILCLGARVIGSGLAIEILHAFLANEFEGGRHAERLEKISQAETPA